MNMKGLFYIDVYLQVITATIVVIFFLYLIYNTPMQKDMFLKTMVDSEVAITQPEPFGNAEFSATQKRNMRSQITDVNNNSSIRIETIDGNVFGLAQNICDKRNNLQVVRAGYYDGKISKIIFSECYD